MIMLIDRSRRRDLRHLDWRIRLFSIGAALGLGGIWLESSWLVLSGTVVLIGGFGLRFLPNDPETGREEDDGDQGA